MAEILSVASGIAGLLSLTIQIIEASNEFVNDYKGAPKDGKAYFEEVKILRRALESLRKRLDDQKIREFVSTRHPTDIILSGAQNGLECCSDILRSLLDSLTRYNTGNISPWERFKWHFKKSSISDEVERLLRYRMMILDDFENCLTFRTAQGVQGLVASQATILESVDRLQHGNTGLQRSSDDITMKVGSFLQEIMVLKVDITHVGQSIDRFEISQKDTLNTVQRMDRQQNVLQTIGETNASHSRSIVQHVDGKMT